MQWYRYASYPEASGWCFPGVGEFQCFDRRALASLAESANRAGHPEWGYSGPHDSGEYNSHPEVLHYLPSLSFTRIQVKPNLHPPSAMGAAFTCRLDLCLMLVNAENRRTQFPHPNCRVEILFCKQQKGIAMSCKFKKSSLHNVSDLISSSQIKAYKQDVCVCAVVYQLSIISMGELTTHLYALYEACSSDAERTSHPYASNSTQ